MHATELRPRSDAHLQEVKEAARDCGIELPPPSRDVDTIVQEVRRRILELALLGNAKAEHHKRRFERLDQEDEAQKLHIATSSAGKEQPQGSLPPEVVGIILSHLPPEATAALPHVLDTLSVDSDSAQSGALLTRDSANKAIAAANQTLLTLLNQIIEGSTPELDSATASALADVHHAEGLNKLFKKCTSAEMLQQMIHFLTVHCPHLRQLDLSRVENLAPSHLLLLSKFRLLHALSLAHTSIDDTHVEALQGLQLTALDLSYTPITGGHFNTLSREIQELNLQGCSELTDEAIEGLGERKNADGTIAHAAMQLVKCSLIDIPITGRHFNTLSREIRELNLAFCNELTDEAIEGLGEKKNADGTIAHAAMQLVKCDLRDTPTTGRHFNTLSRGIQELNLAFCHELTDEAIEGLGEKKNADSTITHDAMQLVTCNLRATSITGRHFNTLSREIRELNLELCGRLTDEAIEGLGEKKNADGTIAHAAMPLVTCNLISTPVTGRHFNTLSRGIQELNLAFCHELTDEAIEGLGEKKNADSTITHDAMQLVTCNLRATSITGRHFNTLSRGIHELDLAYCGQLTNEGVQGLVEKKDGAGKVLWRAMQLVRCSLPLHISL